MNDPAQPSEEALLDLRPRLVRYFSSHGQAWAAEDLADEVIFRVLNKSRQGEIINNLAAYSLGVARLVLLEHLRGPLSRQKPLEGDFPSPALEADLAGQDCLERCLRELPAAASSLILRFYGDGQLGAKNKDVRKNLAAELGISVDALFNRAHKLRRRLGTCVEVCLLEPVDAGRIVNRGFDHSQERI